MLRGIDNAFDKHDAKALRSSKQNAQGKWSGVVRAERDGGRGTGDGGLDRRSACDRAEAVESGFETERVGSYLEQNAGVIEAAKLMLRRMQWPLKSLRGCGRWPWACAPSHAIA